jgi:hypothetical protein
MPDETLDTQPPRLNWDLLKQGPTAADLEEIPATTAADWQDAVIIEPLPDDIVPILNARIKNRPDAEARPH